MCNLPRSHLYMFLNTRNTTLKPPLNWQHRRNSNVQLEISLSVKKLETWNLFFPLLRHSSLIWYTFCNNRNKFHHYPKISLSVNKFQLSIFLSVNNQIDIYISFWTPEKHTFKTTPVLTTLNKLKFSTWNFSEWKQISTLIFSQCNIPRSHLYMFLNSWETHL